MSSSIGAEAGTRSARAEAASAGNSAMREGRRYALDAPGGVMVLFGTGAPVLMSCVWRDIRRRRLAHVPAVPPCGASLRTPDPAAGPKFQVNAAIAALRHIRRRLHRFHRVQVRMSGLLRDIHHAVVRAWRPAPVRA